MAGAKGLGGPAEEEVMDIIETPYLTREQAEAEHERFVRNAGGR